MADGDGFGTELWIMLGVYLFVLLVALACAAVLRWRRSREATMVERYLAGRALGPVALGFSLGASIFAHSTVIGIPAEAYSQGFSAWRWLGSCTFISIVFMAYAPRLQWISRVRGYDSIMAFVKDRYGISQPCRDPFYWLVVLVFLFACYIYLCAQLDAFGRLMSTISGGKVTVLQGALGLAGLLSIFEILGGLRAVVFTDVVQGVVLVVGSLLMLFVIDTSYGGLPGITAQLALGHVRVPRQRDCLDWAELWIGLGIQRALLPDFAQRAMAAESQDSLRMGSAILAVAPFLVQVPMLFFGLVARARLPALLDPKDAFSLVVLDIVGQGGSGRDIGSIMMVASIAAVMSTADSVLSVASQIITLDICRPLHAALVPASSRTAHAAAGVGEITADGAEGDCPPPKAASAPGRGRWLPWVGHVATVAVAFLCIPLVFASPDFDFLLELSVAVLAQALPTIVLALYWTGVYKWASAAGLVVGLGLGLGLVATEIPGGILLSLLGNWVVTLTLCFTLPKLAAASSEEHARVLRLVFWRRLAAPALAECSVPPCGREPVNSWWGLSLLALVLPWFALPLYRTEGTIDPNLSGAPLWAVVVLLALALVHALVVYIIGYHWQGAPAPAPAEAGAEACAQAPGEEPRSEALPADDASALRHELQALRAEVKRLSESEASTVRLAMREEIGALFA